MAPESRSFPTRGHCPERHLASLYDSEEERRAALAPLLRGGLERGEKVVCIVDAAEGPPRCDGVDVGAFLASGQLSVLPPEHTFLRNQAFDPDAMIDLLRREAQRAADEGYAGLRVLGEMTWALRGLPGCERLIEYENRLNVFLHGSHCLVGCQYDRRRFAPATLLDVIAAHPFLVVGAELHDNFYYIAPDELVDRDLPAAKLRRQLDTLAERKQGEEALRESRAQWRSLVENAPDVILSVDRDGRILFMNRTPGDVSVEEVVGTSAVEYAAPEHRDTLRRSIDRVVHSGEPDHCEVAGRRVLGTVPWYSVHLGPVKRGREVVAVTLVAREITERKRARHHLARYAASLEQANEELRRFTYIVSHDLRAPLVNLKGFAAELRTAVAAINDAMNAVWPQLDENQREAIATATQDDIPEALGFIDASVTRMDTFINALLKLSRAGRRRLQREPIDMDALVQASLETLAHQIEERQVNVTVGSLPQVVADRTSMEQVVGNLLNNAVIYLDPSRPGQIEITGGCGDGQTTFCVRDNGRGIAQEDMPKVFAPFRRAGSEDVPGEGMGLAYVQALVHRHGGRIWCESELGAGSTFTFTVANPAQGTTDHA